MILRHKNSGRFLAHPLKASPVHPGKGLRGLFRQDYLCETFQSGQEWIPCVRRRSCLVDIYLIWMVERHKLAYEILRNSSNGAVNNPQSRHLATQILESLCYHAHTPDNLRYSYQYAWSTSNHRPKTQLLAIANSCSVYFDLA